MVFSRPPEGVSDEEFNRWYDAHLDEILSVPGWEAATRYRLDPVVADEDVRYRYLTIYEVEGDPAEAVEELERAGLGSADSYSALKEVDSGVLELPEWFSRTGFASWNLVPLGERVEQAS